jgi:hypothetical protein
LISSRFQVSKQLAANAQGSYDNEQINTLKEAVGVMQHHDAITGTEKQHVANNYYLRLSRGMQSAADCRRTSTLVSTRLQVAPALISIVSQQSDHRR